MATLKKLKHLTIISINTPLALLLSVEGTVLTTEEYACGYAQIKNFFNINLDASLSCFSACLQKPMFPIKVKKGRERLIKFYCYISHHLLCTDERETWLTIINNFLMNTKKKLP